MRRLVASKSSRDLAMTAIPDDAHILIRIGGHPEAAGQIGRFVACFASLELALWELYARVLDKDTGSTIQLLGGIQSFVHKMAAVERYLPSSKLPGKEKCITIFSKAKQINGFRNNLMHGIYVQHADGSLWVYAGRTDPTKNNGQEIKLTSTVTQDKANEAANLAKEIFVTFFGMIPSSEDFPEVTLLRK